MHKAQIWTILGFLHAKLGFKLCAKILGLHIQSLDGADFCTIMRKAWFWMVKLGFGPSADLLKL